LFQIVNPPFPSPPSSSPLQLYVNNLHDRVKKSALKKGLYAAFAPYGTVIDIVATRTKNERGQAWIVFSDVASATRALQAMKDFPFYDKPMRVAYSLEKSHATLKLEGTFKPGQKNESKKRKREEEDEEEDAKKAESGSAQGWRKAKVVKVDKSQAIAADKPQAQFTPSLPSKMLLVQGLTPGADAEATKTLLSGLFGVFHGLADIRVVAERGLAFVEFTNESAATPALQALHNYKVSSGQQLEVRYAASAR
jgi:RNA recognition motif-containing protein